MAGRLIMVADTWGHQQARVHEEELTMMMKLRRWLTKSSGGARGLGDQTVEDDDDTCRDCGGGIADALLQKNWWFEPQNHWLDGFGFGPQNPVGVPAGTGGGIWRHHEACVETKTKS
jgi:hypothetical protein